MGKQYGPDKGSPAHVTDKAYGPLSTDGAVAESAKRWAGPYRKPAPAPDAAPKHYGPTAKQGFVADLVRKFQEPANGED